MIWNYIKVAIRNYKLQKLFSLISVIGLSLAIGISLLGVMFVNQELSYNSFHDSKKDIYRLVTVFGEGMRQQGSLSESPAVLKSVLLDQVPEILYFSRIKAFELPVKKADYSFKEKVFFVENDYFEIFSFPLIRGEKKGLLKDPNTVVLSEHISKKYFGEEDPVNQTIELFLNNAFHEFTVTGVIANAPKNSSIQHDFLFSYGWLINFNPNQYDENAWAPNVFNFVRVSSQYDNKDQIERKIATVVKVARGAFLEERGFNRNAVTYELSSFLEMHLETNIRNWPNTVLLGPAPSNILYSFILISISVVVLTIACINYTTYSIGYSTYRAKEVGVRKTLGAQKNHIKKQFWIETLLLTLISITLGIAILQILLPTINASLGLKLSLEFLLSSNGLLTIFFLWLTVSFASGIYPSLVLAGYTPQKVLKGNVRLTSGKALSHLLIGFQYTGVLILIISLVTIIQQLNMVQNQTFIHEEDQTLLIQNQRQKGITFLGSYKLIKSELQKKGYNKITASFGAVNDDLFRIGYKTAEIDDMMYAQAFITDYDYTDVYSDIELIEGRFFKQETPTDSNNAIVVNESYVKELGLINPVGTIVETNAGRIQNNNVEIIGVVKDFHFESLHEQIKPVVFLPIRKSVATRYISVKVPSEQIPKLLADSQDIWKEIHQALPFEYTFLDQRYKSFYLNEIRWRDIITWSAIIGSLIAIMGIIALTGLSANNRLKEIGVRKVLGAGTAQLILLVGRQFLWPLFWASITAIPISLYLMQEWLKNFSYAVNIGVLPFISAILITLFITIIAFGSQAWKSASMKPVNSLRTE